MLRLLRFQVALAGVFQRGPPGGSTRIDVRTVVAQQHGRHGAGDVLAEIDDAYAFQNAWHGTLSPLCLEGCTRPQNREQTTHFHTAVALNVPCSSEPPRVLSGIHLCRHHGQTELWPPLVGT